MKLNENLLSRKSAHSCKMEGTDGAGTLIIIFTIYCKHNEQIH